MIKLTFTTALALSLFLLAPAASRANDSTADQGQWFPSVKAIAGFTTGTVALIGALFHLKQWNHNKKHPLKDPAAEQEKHHARLINHVVQDQEKQILEEVAETHYKESVLKNPIVSRWRTKLLENNKNSWQHLPGMSAPGQLDTALKEAGQDFDKWRRSEATQGILKEKLARVVKEEPDYYSEIPELSKVLKATPGSLTSQQKIENFKNSNHSLFFRYDSTGNRRESENSVFVEQKDLHNVILKSILDPEISAYSSIDLSGGEHKPRCRRVNEKVGLQPERAPVDAIESSKLYNCVVLRDMSQTKKADDKWFSTQSVMQPFYNDMANHMAVVEQRQKLSSSKNPVDWYKGFWFNPFWKRSK